MKEILFVFLGGGAGSVLRFLTSVCWQRLAVMPSFAAMWLPWHTLIVNVVGCFLIAVFYIMSERCNLSAETRLLLTTGLCGGFTTFSTFSHEGLQLLRNGQYAAYAAYFGLSLLLGLTAAALPYFWMTKTELPA